MIARHRNNNPDPQTPPTRRVAALDQFRGVLVFCMIAANFLAGFSVVPDWLKHSRVFGTIDPIDVGVTLFMFTVGLSLGIAFERRMKTDGIREALTHFIRRDLVLILFGVTGSLLLQRGILRDWEVLQSIGLASLVALPFLFLAPLRRFLAGVVLVLLFQTIGGIGYWDWLKGTDGGGLGGIVGGLAWAGVILFGSSLSTVLQNDWRQYRTVSLALGGAGIIGALLLSQILPLDKRLITASYLSLTTGMAALSTLLFAALTRRSHFRLIPFVVLGVNALIMFMIQAVLILAVTSFMPPSSPRRAIFFALIVIYLVCFTVAGTLYRRRLFIRL